MFILNTCNMESEPIFEKVLYTEICIQYTLKNWAETLLLFTIFARRGTRELFYLQVLGDIAKNSQNISDM